MRAFEEVYNRLYFTWIFGFFLLLALSVCAVPSPNPDDSILQVAAALSALWFLFFVPVLAVMRVIAILIETSEAIAGQIFIYGERERFKRKNSDITAPLHINVNDFARGMNRIMLGTFNFDDPLEEIIEQPATQNIQRK